ncbi:MAG: hypothetical protein MJ201_04990 [Mycoplasmoidaceae bacterium]|nr:hypothetical protein [Mycoplasmoidaceae bacterium]
MYQLGLYLFLRKINKGLFAVCFLERGDYAHPENFKIENHEVYLRGFGFSDVNKFKAQVVDPARD